MIPPSHMNGRASETVAATNAPLPASESEYRT